MLWWWGSFRNPLNLSICIPSPLFWNKTITATFSEHCTNFQPLQWAGPPIAPPSSLLWSMFQICARRVWALQCWFNAEYKTVWKTGLKWVAHHWYATDDEWMDYKMKQCTSVARWECVGVCVGQICFSRSRSITQWDDFSQLKRNKT